MNAEMAKLKAFTTNKGFFELAVGVPTKKAAAELLGVAPSSFAHGFTRQTSDPNIVAAVSARPGVVLQRTIGSNAKFKEHAELPEIKVTNKRRRIHKADLIEQSVPKAKSADRKIKPQWKIQKLRKKAVERAQKERERAQAAYSMAEKKHGAMMRDLQQKRSRIDRQIEAEEKLWEREKRRLSH